MYLARIMRSDIYSDFLRTEEFCGKMKEAGPAKINTYFPERDFDALLIRSRISSLRSSPTERRGLSGGFAGSEGNVF